MAWIGKSAWFPLMLGGTWKSGLTPLRFWPGGEAANPDALHPGKARESSAGESLLSPSDFPRLSWARSPQTFRNPSATAGTCILCSLKQLRLNGSRDEPPMTACGGNIIGGEISRNKQCPLCGLALIEAADRSPLAQSLRPRRPQCSLYVNQLSYVKALEVSD